MVYRFGMSSLEIMSESSAEMPKCPNAHHLVNGRACFGLSGKFVIQVPVSWELDDRMPQ